MSKSPHSRETAGGTQDSRTKLAQGSRGTAARSWASQLQGLVSQWLRQRAVGYIEVERRELENIFALLVLGSFVGLPAPPAPLSLRLLPHLGRELAVLQSRSREMDDVYAEIASLFDL